MLSSIIHALSFTKWSNRLLIYYYIINKIKKYSNVDNSFMNKQTLTDKFITYFVNSLIIWSIYIIHYFIGLKI